MSASDDSRLEWTDVLREGWQDANPGGPLVAVVVSLAFPGMGGESHAIMRAFTRSAFDELLDRGARVLPVDSAAADAALAPAVAAADGVLFLGGGDVDARLYGHTGPVPNEYGVDRAADDYCLGLLGRSLELDQPVLAVCRGSQLLNVALGGTLVPDLQPADGHKGAPGEPLFTDEHVTLEADSRAAAAYGRTRVTVRSGHHQAVDRVGEGLRVTARADDGVVEGTEHTGRTWVVGLQWHPEDRDGSAGDRALIFGALVAQAALRRGRVGQRA